MAATAEALRDSHRGDSPPVLSLVPLISPVCNYEPPRHVREYTEIGYLTDGQRDTLNMTKTFLAGLGAQVVGHRLRQFTGKPTALDIFVTGDQRGILMGGKIHKVDEGDGRVRTETVFSYLS